MKCVLRLSWVVHEPIYGSLMGCTVNGFLSILKRKVPEKSTLGTRGFSWAVSGFGQVLKSESLKTSSPLVSSAFGRTRVGLWPTKRSSPSHA